MIIKGKNYGDVRKQASMETPHGLTTNTIEDLGERMEKFLPNMTNTEGRASRQFFEGLLPKGAELDPRTKKQANLPSGITFPGFGGAFGRNTMMTPQRPYQPEFESPDRCCIEGTKITMCDGLTKNIEDIEIGDLVLDRHGKERTVADQWCSGTPKELVEIKLWGGDTLYVTKNHNLPVWAWVHKCLCGCDGDVKPGRCYLPNHYAKDKNPPKLLRIDGEKLRKRKGRKSPLTGKTTRKIPEGYEPYQKLHAEDIRANDYLLIPRTFQERRPKGITKIHARLLGYYISEGCKYTAGSTNHLCGFLLYFGLHEKNTIAKDALNLCNKLKIDVKLDINKSRNVCRVSACGKKAKEIVKWLIEHGGQYASEKRLSNEVIQWPLELKRELIKGMFRGDGSRFINNTKSGKSFKINYTTVSPYLPKQVQLILAQLGFFATINKHRAKNARPHHFDTYKLHIMGEHALNLAPIIWEKPKHKHKDAIRNRFPIDEKFVKVPIRNVKIIKNSSPVYNITVNGDHSYLIDNIGSFNSHYPVHRILANRYWRLFFKLDPTIGTCVDMLSTMPWSEFQLTGEGVGGEVKEMMEIMCQETQLLRILEYVVREFLVLGEAVPHCFFDDLRGIWTYIAMHNPDQLEVIDAPFIKMDPIIEFIPDDRLRAVLTSNNHLLRRVREQMPQELISRLVARQNIPLSPINCTFIPRKLHPYDTRGTSIISRMWRVLMYEDSQPPGTPITRPDGTNTPIEQLVIGDAVIGKDGDVQEITHISEKHSEKLISLEAQGGWKVKCTSSHKWPIFKDGESESIKTLASDIKIGDYLSIPRKFKESELDEHSNKMTARLFGYYVAEGSRTINKETGYGVAWCFGIDEKDTWVKDVAGLCKELGCDTKVYLQRKSGCQIRSHKLANTWLADWLFKNGGERAEHKCLSQMVMGWPLELKEEFIRGYFRGDGSYPPLQKRNKDTSKIKNKSNLRLVRASTISESLVYQLQLILAQLGIFSKIMGYQHPCSDGRNRKFNYFIESGGIHGDKLATIVWGADVVPERMERSSHDRRADSKIIITEKHLLVPITKVSIEKYDGLVYSLETSGDHSYLNANVATYNSIFNASIATARRHSGPIKIAKLGNPQTGWIPSQEHEKKLLQLLAQAELDVNCFPEDTTIVLGDSTSKFIKDIVPGDVVLDREGNACEVAATKVEETNKLTRIHLQDGEYVECTPNHRWPIWGYPRKCMCGCGETPNLGSFMLHHGKRVSDTEWIYPEDCPFVQIEDIRIRFVKGFDPHQEVEASEIKRCDYLKMPRYFKEIMPENVDEDMALMLGAYLNNNNEIKCNTNFMENWTFEKRRKKANKRFNEKNIINWLKKHGGEERKLLSLEAMRWPIDLKIQILIGFIAGNTAILRRKNGAHGYVETVLYDRDLANQFKMMCAQLGSMSSIVPKEYSGGIKYLFRIFGTTATDIIFEINGMDIGFVENERGWSDDKYTYIQVSNIEEIQFSEPQKVINISVCGDHSYLVNGGLGTFNSWLVYHYGINFELVGTTDRIMNISQHSDVIEKYKLIALGISKSFLTGEVSYASSVTGLSVFLQRLRVMRDFFVNSWVLPKFFKPIAKINGWVKRDKSEISHRYRIKRSQKEIDCEKRWILPKIEWAKQLDHTINSELITAMQALETQMGIKFSKTTKYATVGKNFEDEIYKISEEQELEKTLKMYAPEEGEKPGETKPSGTPPIMSGPKPMGGPMGRPTPGKGPAPGVPGAEEIPGAGIGKGPMAPPPMPGGAGIEADKSAGDGGSGPSGKKDPAVRDLDAVVWDHKGRHGNWAASEVKELISLLKDGHTNSPVWEDLSSPQLGRALDAGDTFEVLDIIEDYLLDIGYPMSDIRELRNILDKEGILREIAGGEGAVIRGLPEDSGIMNDNDFIERSGTSKPDIVRAEDTNNLLIGHGNWSGDISNKF